MIEIGIAGAKNSGKTTLIEKLVSILSSDGFTVATIKHTSHKHRFDTPGKDSFRHRKAGARATLAVSESDIALFMPPEDDTVAKARGLLASICDLCLVEGDRVSSRPKVLLTRHIEERLSYTVENVVATYGPDKAGHNVPHFEPGREERLAICLTEHFNLVKEDFEREAD